MKILNELDAIINLLEADIPANILDPKNLVLEKRLSASLAEYFRNLENAFPYDEIDRLYYKYVSEQLGSETKDLLDPFIAAFSDDFLYRVNGYAVTAYLKGSAEMISWGRTKIRNLPIFYEGPPIEQAINYAEKHCATLVTKMNEESKRRIASVISQGIENKRGIPGITRDLKTVFNDMTTFRSRMIARTETNDALSQSFIDRAKDMEITGKEWVVNDPCEICQENEGVQVGIDDVFPSGHDRPPAHPNCLLPGNMVLPLGIMAMTRAYYSGQAIEIHTRSGNKLTVTINHPVLTPFGFVSAEGINKGDYIISSSDSKGMASSINPDYNNIPIAIEKIWESFILTFSMSLASMKVAPIDFHGDARFFDGDVDVIFTNRFLERNIGDTPVLEHINHNKLDFGDTKLPFFSSLRPLRTFGKGLKPITSSLMCSSRPGLSFFGGKLGHHDCTSFALGTRSNVISQQPTPDDTPINFEFLTEGKLGFAGQVKRYNVGVGQGFVKTATSPNTVSLQNTEESGMPYAELSKEFIHRFARFIAADEVIDVRYFDFSGHVYNLQSLEQLYIGNNIVVKNCNCALAPVMV